MKDALAISWNIIDKKIFTFYFNSSRVWGIYIILWGFKLFIGIGEPCTCCKFGCCGVIFCEWSFSIFIFLELLAFKLLDGG
jgi:hypothetical protein